MKKLTTLSLILLGLFCWLSPTYAHAQFYVIPVGGNSSSDSIVGSWRIGGPGTGESLSVVTFIDGTLYIIAESGADEVSGWPGMELGDYSWDTSTGLFTATVVQETNGDWGFGELDGPPGIWTVSLDGNTLSFTDGGEDSFELTRVIP